MHYGLRLALSSFGALAFVAACSSTNSLVADAGTNKCGPLTCASEAAGSALTKAAFAACSSCTAPNIQPPLTCADQKPIKACCAYLPTPSGSLASATGLHYNSGVDPKTVDLSCLDDPGPQGTPQTVTLTGYVKLFSSGDDSSGVKIEIFQEGANGALGALVGMAVVTKDSDAFQSPKPTWSSKCPTDGCTLRKFSYPGIPTETPLIIKTSDAAAAQKWSELYDYNIYFANGKIGQNGAAAGEVRYDPSAVAATDINAVASAAGGFTIKPDKGVIAGEIHDCADVKLAGAVVNTDYRPEGSMLYFDSNESNPLPNSQQSATSVLGLFGALNYPTGVPIRVSAVGRLPVTGGTGGDGGATCGDIALVGTYVVQVFPGAVTAFSLRGRRPYQK